MFSPPLCLQIVVASVIVCSSAKLLTSPSQLPKDIYDYIVVGAGTAGNVVAARLTENPLVSVLVLEAGISNEDIQASMIPLFGTSLTPNTPFDWNYTTTTQAGFNGRKVPYPRGKLLGGSSSVNYMVYAHGSSEDFDRYASHTGDPGWSWDSMAKYRKANEKLVPPVDGHDTKGQFTPSAHSYTGAVSVSLPGFPTPLDERITATTEEFSEEFPFIEDTSGGEVLGIGWTLSSIGNGTRSSSATAYLEPALHRPNLDVLINAHVTKLVQTGMLGGIPSFHSLQFASYDGGEVTTVVALREIVLSAGAFGTPSILQLSGIGDKEDLEVLGIETIVDNPSVGRNMSDHTLLTNPFMVNSTRTFGSILKNADVLNAYVEEWSANRTGPLVDGIASHVGWLRLPDNSSIFDTVADPAAGPRSSHYEMVFSNMWIAPKTQVPTKGDFISFTTNLISPTSRGTVKLSSNNPFDAPLIDPNYLSTDFDIFAMKTAVQSAKKFATGSAWKDFIIEPYSDLANTQTDEELEQYIRNRASTVFHATGTASMSPRGATWGVVDPDLKVKGVEGIRIVDGSVIPFAPNAHIQGPIYLFGERGADLIKKDHDIIAY